MSDAPHRDRPLARRLRAQEEASDIDLASRRKHALGANDAWDPMGDAVFDWLAFDFRLLAILALLGGGFFLLRGCGDAATRSADPSPTITAHPSASEPLK